MYHMYTHIFSAIREKKIFSLCVLHLDIERERKKNFFCMAYFLRGVYIFKIVCVHFARRRHFQGYTRRKFYGDRNGK